MNTTKQKFLDNISGLPKLWERISSLFVKKTGDSITGNLRMDRILDNGEVSEGIVNLTSDGLVFSKNFTSSGMNTGQSRISSGGSTGSETKIIELSADNMGDGNFDNDVILKGIESPNEDNDAVNKKYVDNVCVPITGANMQGNLNMQSLYSITNAKNISSESIDIGNENCSVTLSVNEFEDIDFAETVPGGEPDVEDVEGLGIEEELTENGTITDEVIDDEVIDTETDLEPAREETDAYLGSYGFNNVRLKINKLAIGNKGCKEIEFSVTSDKKLSLTAMVPVADEGYEDENGDIVSIPAPYDNDRVTVTNVDNPVDNYDAANKKYVDEKTGYKTTHLFTLGSSSSYDSEYPIIIENKTIQINFHIDTSDGNIIRNTIITTTSTLNNHLLNNNGFVFSSPYIRKQGGSVIFQATIKAIATDFYESECVAYRTDGSGIPVDINYYISVYEI